MKIAFLGDSITFGAMFEHPEEVRYTGIVCNKLGAEEINLGICGTLMARAGMNRLDNRDSFVERVSQTDGADFTVVFGGTNDYFWTDAQIEEPENAAEGEDRLSYFRPAVSFILDHLLETVGKDNMLIITPLPHHGYGNFRHGKRHDEARFHDTDAPNFMGYCLEDYCDVIKEETEKRGIALLDLFTEYGRHSAGFDWQHLTVDGCHPNEEGHRMIADKVYAKIVEITEKKKA